jgi:hypothetical protein
MQLSTCITCDFGQVNVRKASYEAYMPDMRLNNRDFFGHVGPIKDPFINTFSKV